ncbi:MAG: hypothetical protein A3A28_03835 [Candidatus Sungbacteria bacterium RIFCSPLOWO2_01_FULL_47_32]|nr:MAG: hypothetical protein A3A28_03835 [Candidatus Sungbacteria bacterium RIFCSPLOWO2_01_FULL_47_32]
MLRILMFSLIAATLFASHTLASEDDAKLLAGYEKEAVLSSGGMCDSMRSNFVSFTGTLFTEMVEFVPMSASKRFYVVKKGPGNEYFIETFADEKGPSRVRKLTAMEWSQELMPESINFFLYTLLPEKQHDCRLSTAQ